MTKKLERKKPKVLKGQILKLSLRVASSMMLQRQVLTWLEAASVRVNKVKNTQTCKMNWKKREKKMRIKKRLKLKKSQKISQKKNS